MVGFYGNMRGKGEILMKRMIKKWLGILVLLTLIGCSSESTTGQKVDGVLKPVKQNERNAQLISSLGFDQLFMYDLDIKNKDMKMIYFWIEHYKNGEKQEDLINGATATNEEMSLAVSKLNFKLEDETTYTRWTYSVADGVALSSMESLPMEVVDPEKLGMASTWMDDEFKIKAEKPINLAVIARYDGNSVGIGLDEEIIQRAIQSSDEVYVVKVKVSKNEEFAE